MAEVSLVPRKYKIEQKFNEHFYYVSWFAIEGTPWLIEEASHNLYLKENGGIDYYGHDTAKFATPEEALEFWKKYMIRRYNADIDNA